MPVIPAAQRRERVKNKRGYHENFVCQDLRSGLRRVRSEHAQAKIVEHEIEVVIHGDRHV